MQKPSSVSSGNISPAIVGLNKDTKEVYVIGGVVLALAIVIGAFWYYSGQDQSFASKTPAETLTNAQVTNVLKTGTTPLVEPIVHNQIVRRPASEGCYSTRMPSTERRHQASRAPTANSCARWVRGPSQTPTSAGSASPLR